MYTLYTKVSLQPKIRIIIIFNIYTYSSCIQSSHQNFENFLLPCFVPYSYLGCSCKGENNVGHYCDKIVAGRFNVSYQ